MQTHDYKEHFKRNFDLAYPVMLSQIGHVMVGVADSVMVGQLGAVPLAAVALGSGFFHVLMLFGIGVSYAITPLVAAADGEKNASKSAGYLKHAIYVNLILGAVLGVGLALSSGVLKFFDQEQQVLDYAIPYMAIISYSIIPIMLFQTFRQFAEGLSSTKPAMVISIVGNLINVGLNYLLIFGEFGFPALGVNGAAWATLISRILIGGGMALFVFQSSRYHEVVSLFNWTGVQLRSSIQLLKIGIPAGLQFIFEAGAFAMAAVMMGWIGAKQLAAHQIALNLAAITYMAATGISAAATIRVGNQLGKKDIPTLRIAGNTCFIMVIIFMGLAAMIFILFRNYLPSLYIDDPQVIGYAASLLVIAAFFQLSDGVQVVGLGALRGLADVKMPTLYTLFAYWMMALPVGYFLGIRICFGAEGIWIGLLVGLSISAVMQFWRFRKLTERLQ
ncbi:MAG: MATE family efflux transporter [Cyclobacteriaceae bacterium]